MEDREMDRAAICALNRIFGYKPIMGRQLLDAARSQAGAGPAGLFRMDSQGLGELLGPFSSLSARFTEAELEKSAEELQRLGNSGCGFIATGEDAYPGLLLECEDAPLGLYVKSSTPYDELFGKVPQVAVVGTRDISPYGECCCREIVAALSRTSSHPMIVSGLAFGVDITAHRTALEAGLGTVAVLPCGIDAVYPWRHISWASRIAGTEGCALVTDYPPGTAPVAINFLRRNRIIAGISQAVLLIESRRKGGGMMTARLAGSYGREVFALPGRIDDVRSQGCLQLIREKVAEPVEDVDSFVQALGFGRPGVLRKDSLAAEIASRYSQTSSAEEVRRLVETALLIRKRRGITVSGIAEEMGMEYREASCMTGRLEYDGYISTDLLQRCCIKTKIV